jgi:endonuclease YncB( thermonuclease family)
MKSTALRFMVPSLRTTMRAFVLILLALVGVTRAAAELYIIEGRVIGVADGDTITILDRDKHQHKIRFNGIDAPEKGQASGFRSKENLSKLIYDRNALAECGKRDRYGREVCKVLDGTVDISLEQIRAACARRCR